MTPAADTLDTAGALTDADLDAIFGPAVVLIGPDLGPDLDPSDSDSDNDDDDAPDAPTVDRASASEANARARDLAARIMALGVEKKRPACRPYANCPFRSRHSFSGRRRGKRASAKEN
ncbi:hypothetical protein UCD39_13480 [Nitrospirillum sp. BR 11752]|uniref:hypothetical protein n=1 Tax=Nitrospirillum sp. BR 11752 TaxID=3104293 RepID=UPI002EA30FF7|nr:hypothetical protein [Nitrospirillum sp. BR 11752]